MAATSSAHLAAADGVAHAPSLDPAVHRPLIVVHPPMQGRDVANLQRATQERLRHHGPAHDLPIPTHGKFTPATALACIEAQYWLGLRSDTYLRRDIHGHRVVTEGAQRIIREPDTRERDQLKRAKQRATHRDQAPAFFRAIARDLGIGGHGVEDALAFAAEHVGVKEHPPKSNSGGPILGWCKAAGYTGPVPWCGCFVNACLMAGGLPSGAGWIGYTPSILARAKAGTGGWSLHTTGMPGDLALYDDDPGGDPVVHVELVRKRLSSTRYSCYGGNTSSGDGSPNDGGMVARHDDRSTMGGFRIIGFARPPWQR
jgi:hypothetical protein